MAETVIFKIRQIDIFKNETDRGRFENEVESGIFENEADFEHEAE